MRHSTLIVFCTALSLGACRPEPLTSVTVAPASEGDRVVLASSGDVLYVLDGRVLARGDSTGVPAAVRNLDPAVIRSIEVLKGVRARRAYGDAGSSGVVVITTRDGR